jgi:hypothetical protein
MKLEESKAALLGNGKNIKQLFDVYKQGWCHREFNDCKAQLQLSTSMSLRHSLM